MRFFTADTHFYHEGVIAFDKRPFDNIEEMNEALIANWNNVVTKRDIVYHLGDICWHPSKTKGILERLNGQTHLIKGNHDRPNKEVQGMFASVSDIKRIKIDKTRIYLCHYALRTWPGNDKGIWNLHGHSHGNLKTENKNAIDVGSNCWGYTPVFFEQLKEFMEQRDKTFVKRVTELATKTARRFFLNG